MKRFARSIAVVAASTALMAGWASAEPTYRFGGGPSGGAWHPATSAGTQLLNQELKGKYNFLYTPSGGSVANVRSVGLGNYATAWGHIGQIYESWNGSGQFKPDGVNHNFRIVARVRAQSQIFAVLADNPIKSFSDMNGKVVNMLSRGSGSSVNCVNVFTALGLMDKVEARYLGFAASARALGDRQIDVFCSAGVPFVIPALTQLSVSKPVRYVSLTEEEQKKVTSAFRFYSPITIPPQKDVKGVDQPARSISYDVWWMAHKQMTDEAVYDMLKVIASPENLAKLTKAAAYWKDLSGQFDALVEHKILVHPSAARYWKERGVNVPMSIVKGY
jgi:TRAP transporter TAXI family solute receptor